MCPLFHTDDIFIDYPAAPPPPPVPEEAKCTGCGRDTRDPVPVPVNHFLDFCVTCRSNYCIEHAKDRRDSMHPSYCKPGEW